MLLTAPRVSEATAATWSQIDLEAKTWTVPPDNIKDTRTPSVRRKKAKQALVIPLSSQVIQLLWGMREAKVERQRLNGLPEEIHQHDLLFLEFIPNNNNIFVTNFV